MQQLTESSFSTSAVLNVIDAIYARRAVRQYAQRSVSGQAIEELLNAAVQAPSAMNKQPWAFVVVQDPLLLKRVSLDAKELLVKSAHWQKHSEHGSSAFEQEDFDIFYGATTLIVICAQKDGFEPVGDCYLAAQNLMLAATGMGLATCPIGFAREVLQSDHFRKELAIPIGFDPVLPIIVGYARTPVAKTVRNPPQIFSWLKA